MFRTISKDFEQFVRSIVMNCSQCLINNYLNLSQNTENYFFTIWLTKYLAQT